MKICKTISEVRNTIDLLRKRGKNVGFVPTMGALHEGHAALIRAARKECKVVVVSIFVNPMQFGPTEDFAKYPRPFEADCLLCEREGADVIFAPEGREMCAPGNDTCVVQERLTKVLCGKSRPDHFRGVLTIVLKLFNIIAPDTAYFGQKDAQQVLVIKRMVTDLNLPLKVATIPTSREPDGLAISSRNSYLSLEQRKDAVCLYGALCRARDMVTAGGRDAERIRAEMRRIIRSSRRVRLDYAEIVDAHTLDRIDRITGDVLVAVAVYIRTTRLIDNVCLTIDGKEILC